jgi:hypothetical protein
MAGGLIMAESPGLEKMRIIIAGELREWKIAMEDLADIFHKRFPPIGKHEGWTLHVRKCAKNKQCRMCPHSVLWQKYHYGKATEVGKQKRRAAGKSGSNYVFLWNQGPGSQSMDGLPKTLRASKEMMMIFKEFEGVRATIMAAHKPLVSLHKSILGKQRAERKKQKLRDPAPTVMTDMKLIAALADLLTKLPSKKNVLAKLQDMRKKYPPSSWAKEV